jgi:uncharacterized protein (DUF2235 family)
MGKNLVIFSDGTGQAGGFRFDEVRGNVYKMYRATRCGPDSLVDPREQLAFYDPGLGSQADGGHFMGRLLRWVHNTVAQATGFGITRNIIDCYAPSYGCGSLEIVFFFLASAAARTRYAAWAA